MMRVTIVTFMQQVTIIAFVAAVAYCIGYDDKGDCPDCAAYWSLDDPITDAGCAEYYGFNDFMGGDDCDE